MLPLLLASALGIVVSGFNILIGYKNHSVKSVPAISQNTNVRADAAHANLKSVSFDLAFPVSNPIVVNTEAGRTNNVRTNNVRTTAPTARVQPQRETVRKTQPVTNVPPPARPQSWLIQAGAFSIESSAARIKERIETMGYDARIVKLETDKPVFRVLVSAGNSGASPDDALRRIKSAGIEGYIVVRRP